MPIGKIGNINERKQVNEVKESKEEKDGVCANKNIINTKYKRVGLEAKRKFIK